MGLIRAGVGLNGSQQWPGQTLQIKFIIYGEVLEWLNRPLSKSGKSARASWVRIPPSPPFDSLCSLMVFDQRANEANALSLSKGHKKMDHFAYIILCNNNKYYVGHTNNLESRFSRHLQKAGAKFTAQNTPIKILWKQKFKTEIEAIKRENQIKGWTRVKKENLIKGIWK